MQKIVSRPEFYIWLVPKPDHDLQPRDGELTEIVERIGG